MRSTFLGGLLAALLLALSPVANAQVSVGVAVNLAPPPLPVYEQPPCPGPGYMWIPGYWGWDADDGDYYWVPATWAFAPMAGLLWTPGWWGWNGGAYYWHDGYWAEQVGFYGGIAYGYGYGGRGYEGGYWRGDQFYYNRAANNISNQTNITNVYNQTVVNNVTVNHVSYNGGQGGVSAQPTAQQVAAERTHHVAPTPEQARHQSMARQNRELRASVNAGKPAIAATARPAQVSGAGLVAARAAGGPVNTRRGQGPQAPERGPQAPEQRGGQAQEQRAPAQQQRPEVQQRAEAKQRPEVQQRAEAQQRPEVQQRAESERQQRSAPAQEQQRVQQQRPGNIREAQAPQARPEQRGNEKEKEQRSDQKERGNERRGDESGR